jgi:mono/diheme cytochrome c family protein
MLAEATGREVAFADAVGWSKVPDVIGFGSRVTLSWDGVGEGPMDVLVVEADFAAGVRPAWFWSHPLQGASLGAYLRQPAPRPRFPGPVDADLAERGKALFDLDCAPCHGTYGADGRSLDYDESVVALDDVGTDPARALAPTPSFVEAANDPALTQGITRVAATGGYVPPILTNVWARAPYGHAGQWPSLAVIATDPADRPTRSVLDYDADYDLEHVGLASRAPDGSPLAPGEYLQDGFSVAGHPFLASLGATDARAVIEYLKTL